MLSLTSLKNFTGKKIQLHTKNDENLTGFIKLVTLKYVEISDVKYSDGTHLDLEVYTKDEINFELTKLLDPVDDEAQTQTKNENISKRSQRSAHYRSNQNILNRPVSFQKETPIHLKQMKEPSRSNQLLHVKVNQELANPREAPSLDLEKADLLFLENLSKTSEISLPTHYILLNEKQSYTTKLVYDYLALQNVLGVCCFGCETNDKLFLLGFSTNQLVVLIEPSVIQTTSRMGDKCLEKYPFALLTSSSVQRVAYDARWLAKVIREEFQAKVGDIIDLQVFSHGLFPYDVSKKPTILPLSKLISKYISDLKHPYIVRFNERVDDDALWAKRPLCNTMLNQAFFFLTYLVPIYQTMLKSLLWPVINASNRRVLSFNSNMKSRRFTNPLDSSDLQPYSQFWNINAGSVKHLTDDDDDDADALMKELRLSATTNEKFSDVEEYSRFDSQDDSDGTFRQQRLVPDGGSSGEDSSNKRERIILKPQQMTVNNSCSDSNYFVSGILKDDEPSLTDEDFCSIPSKRRSDPKLMNSGVSSSSLSGRKGRGISTPYGSDKGSPGCQVAESLSPVPFTNDKISAHMESSSSSSPIISCKQSNSFTESTTTTADSEQTNRRSLNVGFGRGRLSSEISARDAESRPSVSPKVGLGRTQFSLGFYSPGSSMS